MNALKYSGIINWIKTHRFWTSGIALWGLHLLVAAMPLNLLDMGGVLEYVLSSQFLGYYALIGGIIWSFQQRKAGYSLSLYYVKCSTVLRSAFSVLRDFALPEMGILTE
jgi:hypothetical protein